MPKSIGAGHLEPSGWAAYHSIKVRLPQVIDASSRGCLVGFRLGGPSLLCRSSGRRTRCSAGKVGSRRQGRAFPRGIGAYSGALPIRMFTKRFEGTPAPRHLYLHLDSGMPDLASARWGRP
jgi:hypothetical protein